MSDPVYVLLYTEWSLISVPWCSARHKNQYLREWLLMDRVRHIPHMLQPPHQL